MARKWTPKSLKQELNDTIRRMQSFQLKPPQHLALRREQWQVILRELQSRLPTIQVHLVRGRVMYGSVQLYCEGTGPDEAVEVGVPQYRVGGAS